MSDNDDDPLSARLILWGAAVVAGCALGALFAVPAVCCLLPLFSLTHSVVYLRRLPEQARGSRHRREAVEGARQRLKTSRKLAGIIAIASLALAPLGPMPLVAGASIAAVWHLVWIGSLRSLNDNLAVADIPRFAHSGSRLRETCDAVRISNACLRPIGSSTVPVMHTILFVLALLPAMLAVTGVRPQPVSARVAGLLNLPMEATPAPTASPSPEAIGLSPAYPSENTPTALPQSPCPDVTHVAEMFARGVPPAAAAALYDSWFEVGGAVIGCPDQPPVHHGRVLIANLSAGQDAPAAVVFGVGRASVLFSDMYATVTSELDRLVWLDERLRWGWGTQQLLHMSGGPCRLAQRYGQQAPTLLPAAVTRILLDVADRTGAVPRLVRQQIVPHGVLFKVDLLQADSQDQIRSIDAITVRYAVGAAVIESSNYRATDRQSCPPSADRLPVVSHALELAAQRR